MRKILSFITLFILCENMHAQVTLIDSFMHGGLMRTYRLYVPAAYNGSSSVPVVLNLHGYTSNAQQQEMYGDFRPIADTANFIIAHPDGTFDASNFRFWNAFGASPVDDIGFLSALLDTVIAHYNIDEGRIYSTGMSNGGYMSYLLACSLGNRIAAIASVTGTMTIGMKNNCNPLHPTPVMQIHGTADAVVPYTGSGVSLPIDTVVKYWVSMNQCSPVPVFTAVPDVVPNDGCTAGHHVFGGGDNGSTVELYKVNGGGHTWPGAVIFAGITNMDFSASKEIWRFFSQYNLNNLATANVDLLQNEKSQILVFPNPSKKNISISFSNDNEKQIQIYNLPGQSIFSQSSNEEKVNVELPEPGIYFIRITDMNRSTTHKIIIE